MVWDLAENVMLVSSQSFEKLNLIIVFLLWHRKEEKGSPGQAAYSYLAQDIE